MCRPIAVLLAAGLAIAAAGPVPAVAQDQPLARYLPATIGGEPLVIDDWSKQGDQVRMSLELAGPEKAAAFDDALAAAGLRPDQVTILGATIAGDYGRPVAVWRFPGADARSFLHAAAPAIASERGIMDPVLRDADAQGIPFTLLVGEWQKKAPLKQLDAWSAAALLPKGDLLYVLALPGPAIPGAIGELAAHDPGPEPTADPAAARRDAATDAIVARIPATISTLPVGTWLTPGPALDWLVEQGGAEVPLADLAAILAAHDRTLDDLATVSAWAGEGTESVTFDAWAADGVPADELAAGLAPLVPAIRGIPAGSAVEPRTIADVPVTAIVAGDGTVLAAIVAADGIAWTVIGSGWPFEGAISLLGGGPAIEEPAAGFSPAPAPSVAPETAEEAIRADVEAGSLDAPTGLLYRVQAYMGDPALPEPYASLPSDGDHGVLTEAALARDTLPEPVAAALAPYLARPSDPSSIFHEPGAAPVARAAGADPIRTAQSDPCPADGWASRRLTAIPVVIWAPCAGPAGTSGMDLLESILEELWPREVAYLGDPIPDAGGPGAGGDPSIDIYLVDPNASIGWGGRRVSLDGDAERAYVLSDHPATRTGGAWRTSGYLVVNRALVGEGADFAGTIAHELFHLLQYAHNTAPSAGGTSESHWFVEASATWATHYFVPDATIPDHRFDRFQASVGSLLTYWIRGGKRYAAWVWPLFMQQERGDRAIADAWTALEGKTGDDIDTALDTILPIDGNLHELAVRAWNGPLPGSATTDAIAPRFQAVRSRLPLTTPSGAKLTGARLTPVAKDGEPYAWQPSLAGLGFGYATADIPAGVQRLVLRAPSVSDATVTAFVDDAAGHWTRHDLTADPVIVCPPFSRIVLVGSNASVASKSGTTIAEVQPTTEGCGWVGTTAEHVEWHTNGPASDRNGKEIVVQNAYVGASSAVFTGRWEPVADPSDGLANWCTSMTWNETTGDTVPCLTHLPVGTVAWRWEGKSYDPCADSRRGTAAVDATATPHEPGHDVGLVVQAWGEDEIAVWGAGSDYPNEAADCTDQAGNRWPPPYFHLDAPDPGSDGFTEVVEGSGGRPSCSYHAAFVYPEDATHITGRCWWDDDPLFQHWVEWDLTREDAPTPTP